MKMMRVCGSWGTAALLAACGSSVDAVGDTDDGADATTDDELGDDTEMSTDLPPAEVSPFEGSRLVEIDIPASNLAFGDYDGDGADDIVVSYTFEYGNTGYSQNLLELMRFDPKSETFETILQRDVNGRLSRIEPGWVDGDDRLDVINVTSVWDTNMVQYAVREDDFEIGPPVPYTGTVLGALVDLDGDRRTDYASVLGSTIRLHTVDQMGGWTETQTLDYDAGCTPVQGFWRDLTDDGRLDLLVIGQCNEGGTLTTYAQAEDGSLSAVAERAVELTPEQNVLADFDDDGQLDLVVGTTRFREGLPPAEATVLAGSPDGSFGDELLHLSTDVMFGAISVLGYDVDSDGVDEPVIRNYPDVIDPELGGALVLVRVDGDELVTHALPFSLNPHHHADLDGDGCDELIEVTGQTMSALFLACE